MCIHHVRKVDNATTNSPGNVIGRVTTRVASACPRTKAGRVESNTRGRTMSILEVGDRCAARRRCSIIL
jgi:hypothetical protein